MRSNFFEKHNFYGTVTVGERGQIVVPSEAREKLKIKPGDKLVAFGHENIIHFMKADALDSFLDQITENIASGIAKVREKVKKSNKGE